MKPIVELKDFERSIYRTFGIFPFVLLLVACIVVYVWTIVSELTSTGSVANLFEPQILADAFFKGTVATVGLYYVARITAIRSASKSASLMDLPEAGTYMPCMSHKNWKDLTYGNLIITQNRFYYQPDKQMSMELDFDHKYFGDFTLELDEPMKSIGLFLITGQKHMVIVKDKTGNVVGRFIFPEPKVYLDLLENLKKRQWSN